MLQGIPPVVLLSSCARRFGVGSLLDTVASLLLTQSSLCQLNDPPNFHVAVEIAAVRELRDRLSGLLRDSVPFDAAPRLNSPPTGRGSSKAKGTATAESEQGITGEQLRLVVAELDFPVA